MSDAKPHNVLLPDAQVDIFVQDKKTVKAAQSLIDDWRFARVSVHVEEGGDVAAAIEAYSGQAQAPNIIIIQSDDVSDSFTEKLEELSAHCDEDTNAIVIGPKNDVSLYRKLIDMGVSDYLVRPVSGEALADIIAKILIEQIGVTGSRVLSFIGAKGGVGTSVLAQNAAWISADLFAQKTLLLDTGAGRSTHAVGLGFEPGTTLYEVLQAVENDDGDSLDRMMFKASDKLHVLAAGGDAMLEDHIGAQDYEKILDALMARYPVVIVDTSQGLPSVQKMFVRRSGRLVLVTGASLPSLRLARVLMGEIKALRGGLDDVVDLIVNMTGLSPASEASSKDIEDALEHSIAASIPFEPKSLMAFESEGRKLLDHKDGAVFLNKHLVPLLRAALSVPADKSAAGAEPGGVVDKLLGALKGQG